VGSVLFLYASSTQKARDCPAGVRKKRYPAYPLLFEFVADKLQFGDNFVTHAKIGFLYDL
jgi:hypothetical protein